MIWLTFPWLITCPGEKKKQFLDPMPEKNHKICYPKKTWATQSIHCYWINFFLQMTVPLAYGPMYFVFFRVPRNNCIVSTLTDVVRMSMLIFGENVLLELSISMIIPVTFQISSYFCLTNRCTYDLPKVLVSSRPWLLVVALGASWLRPSCFRCPLRLWCPISVWQARALDGVKNITNGRTDIQTSG